MFDFLTSKFSTIFSGFKGARKLSEKNIQEMLDNVQDALLSADVPYDVMIAFTKELREEAVGKRVVSALNPSEQFIKLVHDRLKDFLGGDMHTFSLQAIASTHAMVLMGLQGSGKTTTVAKLGYWIQSEWKKAGLNRSILVASVDFDRPAAIDQLEIIAQKAGISFYRALEKNDPIKAAQEIEDYRVRRKFNLLILDTAGRLHIDEDMLQELAEVIRIIKPHYKCLVLDAMTGQQSLNVATAFENKIGFDYAIMSKIDSDSRGGAAFSFRYALKKPIEFVGVGEKFTDLERFHPDRMAGRMLGKGDLLTFAEKADEKIKRSEQEAAYSSLSKGTFSLQDFLSYVDMMGSLGSLSQLIKYMPGMGGLTISAQALQQSEHEMKRFKAIISSMTLKERLRPSLLDASRKKRVAQGSGVTIAQVNQLLERFEQSKQYVKLFKKFGGF